MTYSNLDKISVLHKEDLKQIKNYSNIDKLYYNNKLLNHTIMETVNERYFEIFESFMK